MSERELYETDRPSWLSLVAPKQASRMMDDTYDDATLAAVWAAMARDYQSSVWALLGNQSRARIRALRSVA